VRHILDKVSLVRTLDIRQYLEEHKKFAEHYNFNGLDKKKYLEIHNDIVKDIANTQQSFCEPISYEEYLRVHDDIVAKNLKVSTSETDEYILSHKNIVEAIKKSCGVLQFDIKNRNGYITMTSKIVVSGNPSEYKLLFKSLEEKQYKKIYGDLIIHIHDSLNGKHNILGINFEDVEFTSSDVCSSIKEVINRVEMRRVYYHIFHNGMDMSELNTCALYCFWMLKLKPFRHKTNAFSANKINAFVAILLFLCTVNMVSKGKLVMTNEIMKNLIYSFQYHDLSKEAIMALAASLVV